MRDHQHCPECNSIEIERVFHDEQMDVIRDTYICNECPTEFIVEWGRPEVIDVVKEDDI